MLNIIFVINGKVQHFYVEEINGSFTYSLVNEITESNYFSPAMLISTKDSYLQLVVTNKQGNVEHWWRDTHNTKMWLKTTEKGFSACSSAPSLYQTSDNFFQVMVKNNHNQLEHWWRDDRENKQQWKKTGNFSANTGAFSSAPVIAEATNGHLHVMAQVDNNHLEHWVRIHNGQWQFQHSFLEGCTSAPALIRDTDGNLQLVVRKGPELHHLKYTYNPQDPAASRWEEIASITATIDGTPVFVQASDGSLHILLFDGKAIEHSIKSSQTNTWNLVNGTSPVELKHLELPQGKSFPKLAFKTIKATDLNYNNNIEIVVEPSIHYKYQTMLGFGAAMTEASAINLKKLEEVDKARYDITMQRLFSKNKKYNGIGINLLRIPIGSSDFSSSAYTLEDVEDTFTPEKDLASIIPVLKYAKQINENLKIIASPWSAPAWMKDTNSLGGGKLKADCYGKYANYLLRFIQYYQEQNLPIYGITIQNEPLHETPTYPSMYMSSDECIEFLKILGPKFQANKITTKIIVYDHNFAGGQCSIDYVKQIYANQDVAKYVAGSAWHYYGGEPENLKELVRQYPFKEIYFTERTTSLVHENNRELEDIVKRNFNVNFDYVADLIFRVIDNGSNSALTWNLALNEAHGPKISPPWENGQPAGLINIDFVDKPHDTKNRRVYKDGSYAAIGLFAKQLKEGAKRIFSTLIPKEGDLSVQTLAFLISDNKVVLLVRNKSNVMHNINIKLGKQKFESMILAANSCHIFKVEISAVPLSLTDDIMPRLTALKYKTGYIVDAHEQWLLGKAYVRGQDVAQDFNKAFNYYFKAARLGHVNAQYELGRCYEHGLGIPKDSDKSFKWYRSAAKQGHVNAMYDLGRCYDNVVKKFKWFKSAAERGHKEASGRVAEMARDGSIHSLSTYYK